MDTNTITLTTEHPKSCDGLPVLVIDGVAFGPGDLMPDGRTAAEFVATWAERFYGPKWSAYLRRRSAKAGQA